MVVPDRSGTTVRPMKLDVSPEVCTIELNGYVFQPLYFYSSDYGIELNLLFLGSYDHGYGDLCESYYWINNIGATEGDFEAYKEFLNYSWDSRMSMIDEMVSSGDYDFGCDIIANEIAYSYVAAEFFSGWDFEYYNKLDIAPHANQTIGEEGYLIPDGEVPHNDYFDELFLMHEGEPSEVSNYILDYSLPSMSEYDMYFPWVSGMSNASDFGLDDYYLGESTLLEMSYAYATEKDIELWIDALDAIGGYNWNLAVPVGTAGTIDAVECGGGGVVRPVLTLDFTQILIACGLGADYIPSGSEPWSAETYEVTLNNGNVYGEGRTTISVTQGGKWPDVTPPTNRNYQLLFQGYYDLEGGAGTQYYDEYGKPLFSIVSTEKRPPLNLYASWGYDDLWTNYPASSFGGGSGKTEDDAIEISSAAQLALLAKQVNSGTNYAGTYFKQTADIDLAAHSWDPIGHDSYYFAGNYDGQNYKIRNLIIRSFNSGVGIFGRVFNDSSKAVIKNVVLRSGRINHGNYVGGIVGGVSAERFDYSVSTNTEIINCKNYCPIYGSTRVGGIVGFTALGTKVINCKNDAEISSNDDVVGGICGESFGTITNCSNSGTIIGCAVMGGIVGYAYNLVSRCFNSGIIKLYKEEGMELYGNHIGGIAGILSGGKVEYCVANAYINIFDYVRDETLLGHFYIGGVVGEIGDNTYGYSLSETASVIACFFKGTGSKDFDLCGGVYGNSTMTACWQKCNNKIQVSSSVTSDSANWTKYWSVAPNMNDGLPMQKALYFVASVVDSTAQEISAALPNAQVYA